MTSTDTNTPLRGPHEIEAGDRIAYRAGTLDDYKKGAMIGTGPWDLRYCLDSTDARFWRRRAEDNQHYYRVLSNDEIRLLRPQDVVVRIGDGIEGVVRDHAGTRIIHWGESPNDYLYYTAERGYCLALMSLGPEHRKIPDGSFDKPYLDDYSLDAEILHQWVDYKGETRIHYTTTDQGHVKERNDDGPSLVAADGTRHWDDGSILRPGVYTDNLPGGGPNEPWSNGFDPREED